MSSKMKKKVLILLLVGILAYSASAIRVGVVVSYSGSTEFTKCVSVPEGTDGYEVMQATALDIEWDYYDALFGHSLCGIEDTGCSSSNCWCGGDSYWGLMMKGYGESGWTYLPVGFDGGTSCWNGELTSWDGHYCAEANDMIGVAWGPYGTQPTNYEFTDICSSADINLNAIVDDLELLDYIDLWAAGDVSGSELLNAIDAWANNGE